MAPDDSFWARRAREEKEAERKAQEEAENEALKAKRARQGAPGKPAPAEILSARFDELSDRAQSMIHQLESLYRQFATGVLSRPPIEERSKLDQIMAAIQRSERPSAADRFRFVGILQTYNTHKAKWDKLLADVESGKIKRVAGPKKGPQRF